MFDLLSEVDGLIRELEKELLKSGFKFEKMQETVLSQNKVFLDVKIRNTQQETPTRAGRSFYNLNCRKLFNSSMF